MELAGAVGIGVKPKELNLKVVVGRETETEILVTNAGEEPALYQVYPDGLIGKIAVQPTDFRLEPNGSQIIKVIVRVRSPGKLTTNLSVIARPFSSSGFSAATGVKVPINIEASGIPWWWVVLGTIISVCLLVLFVIRLKKKRL